jgi:hypothetical protein
MKSRWEQYKEKNGATPLDMLNPNSEKTSEEVANSRFNICLSCNELTPHTHRCKQCGCFMNLKTKLVIAKCPLSKW